MDFLLIVVGIFIVFLILKQLFYYFGEGSIKLSPEEEAELKRMGEARFEDLNKLTKRQVKNMTVHAIKTKIGNGCEDWMVMVKLQSNKWECDDYDGTVSSEDRAYSRKTIGTKNPRLICPHCQIKGGVYKKLDETRREQTRDSTNITAAILKGVQTTTRKVTQLHCVNCDTTWDI